ncbi:MAG: histidine kinase [Spirochaetes bacterium]|nr:histidine kinase [Spirochaetota bacterium]
MALLCAALLAQEACSPGFSGRTPPAARQGTMDLGRWDFMRDGPVDLSGTWGFYWKRLYDGGASPFPHHPDAYIPVPGIWNGLHVRGRELRGDGYGTYRLRVLLPRRGDPDDRQKLAVMVHDMGTAYSLFFGGSRVGGGGVVGRTAGSARPGYWPDVFEFYAEDHLDIALQISNFHHRKGGAWEKIVIGPASRLHELREQRITCDFFLFGAIILMGAYHLVIFCLRKKERSCLYFGLFCLLIAVRIMVTGEYYVVRMVPSISWELLLCIEYITFYASVPLFFLFLRTMFPEEFTAQTQAAIVAAGALFCSFVLLLPSRYYTSTMQTYQLLSVCICLHSLGALGRALLRKREGSLLIILGFIILFVTVINDFLQSNMLVRTGYLVPFGLFLFIFLQAAFLSLRFSRAYNAVEHLTGELEQKNMRLVELIRDNEEARCKLLQERMGPHFLFNALNTVHSLLRKDSQLADEAVIMLADNYRFLIDNSFLPLIPFDSEWQFVKNYLKLEELRFRDSLSVCMERQGDFTGISVPPLVLQPLVENALKHGIQRRGGSGTVRVCAERVGGTLRIIVWDNGPGLASTADVFSRSLGNIRKRLSYYYNDVDITLNAEANGVAARVMFVPGAMKKQMIEKDERRDYGH